MIGPRSGRGPADAGQAFPVYITAVAGLLFLALAYFAVGMAAATRNEAQSAADAAALAAAQEYRDALRADFLRALQEGTPWQGLLDGLGADTGGVCAAADTFAGKNGASVMTCQPNAGARVFPVRVRTLQPVGDSVIPATKTSHATASATAVVEPLCAVDPDAPEPGSGEGEAPDGGGPLELRCDGEDLVLDPEDLTAFPEADELYSVGLAQ
ncbi:pilus assembly protein TadG-related protein [Streptomyces sp. URMC 123]|uniref:pilus assembly protein TadG-related protein n=1 Tax=Streptomyces sp. URMC 123 TaxID=3423403 RepID=UPI003F1E021A